MKEAADDLQKERDRLSSATPWQQQTNWYDQVEDRIRKKEDMLESAIIAEEDAKSAWGMIKASANEAGFYVYSSKRGVKVMKPALRILDMKMTLLKNMLAASCMGAVAEDLLKGFIPMERRWIEGLHLCLNMGNAWYELARDVLHYLLLPSGEPRPQEERDSQAQTWPAACAGSIQRPSWLEKGFNFQLFLVAVLGAFMWRPLQKFHGSQIEALFRCYEQIWERPPLKDALDVLVHDKTVGLYVRDLLKGWKAVSRIHSLINTHPAKPAEMEEAVREYRQALSTFEFELPGGTPNPCFMKRKFYDHAALDHLVEQTKRLHEMGLSHAVVSSRWLENCNSPAKANARMMPGGGKTIDGRFGNDVVWLIFQYLTQTNFAKRRLLTKKVHAEVLTDGSNQAGPSPKRTRLSE